MLSPEGAGLTVLFCEPPRRCTKIFDGENVLAYDAGAWFSHTEIHITGISDLADVLSQVRACPEAVVIRGRIREGAPDRILRRYKESQGYVPQILAWPSWWVCLDFDDTRASMDQGPEAAVREILSGLPEGLREASTFWQLSSSAHKYRTFRGHLWFFLDRPYADQELRRALKGIGADLSLFNPVQPHYVADPIFVGSSDPVPVRCGLLRGSTDTAAIRGSGAGRLRDIAEDTLDKAEKAIRATIKSKSPRHVIVNREAFKLGQLCPHLLNEGDVFRRLFAAASEGEGALPADRAQDEIRRALEDGKSKPELQGQDWKGLLSYGKGYQPASTLGNVTTILENDPRWADVFSWNDRLGVDWYRREPPLGDLSARIRGNSPVTDQDSTAIVQWLAREYEVNISKVLVEESISKISKESPFDPVEEYLSSLEWDQVSRIADLPRDLFGDPSQVARESFRNWMVSAVRRIYEPGCQSDHTVVLEGLQGLRKSSFWEWLANGYYGSLKSDITSKDSVIALQSAWIVDMTELGAMRRSDVAAMKDFLTTRVDRIRPPYGRREIMLPRRCAIAATHNPDQDEGYLRDHTGNRRIWPIMVTKQIEHLTQELRDNLWAEARALYLAGETSWELSDVALSELRVRHEERLEDHPLEDPWLPSVAQYLSRTTTPTISGVLTLGVALPLERVTNRERKRVARIMRSLGWTMGPYVGGKSRSWLPPEGHQVEVGNGVVVPMIRK